MSTTKSDTDNEISKRLKVLRKETRLTQTAFAEKIGIKQSSYNDIETGKRAPSQPIISSVVYRFAINEEWLKTGKGAMFGGKGDLEQYSVPVRPEPSDQKPQDAIEVGLITAEYQHAAAGGPHNYPFQSEAMEQKTFKQKFSLERDLVRLFKYYIETREKYLFELRITLKTKSEILAALLNESVEPDFYLREKIIELLICENILAEDGTVVETEALNRLEVSQGEPYTFIPKKSFSYTKPSLIADYITAPRHEMPVQTDGGFVVCSNQIVDYLAVKATWLASSLGITPSRFAIVSVVGDSMEPYLTEGDLIMIGMDVLKLENNAVYVLEYGTSLIVRRIQVKLDGEIVVKCDNPTYESETIRCKSGESPRVVGRVVRRLVR